jgi:quercetin dioxygenase-like cupin family protein
MVLASMLVGALIAGSPRAESAEESPVIWAAGDAGLQWGPCPAFLPQGCQIAVLHGDPGKPNADIFLRVPAKSKLPMHWHSSAERMVLVAGELHVTYEGQKTAVMKPGSYAYGPSKQRHAAECASVVPCVLFIAFESPVDAVPAGG